MEWPLLIIGFLTGVYGVMVGAGGGFILVPILVLFWGIDPSTAAGTSLALVAINSWSGSYGYRKIKLIDYRSGFLFAIAAIPGSVFAPILLGYVDSGAFKALFGLLLLLLCFQIAFRTLSESSKRNNKEIYCKDDPSHLSQKIHPSWMLFKITHRNIFAQSGTEYSYQFNEYLAILFNLVLGFISSFFGTGGGFIRTPILVSVFNFPVQVAVATSIFALSIYAFVGAVTHGVMGNIDVSLLLWAGVGLVAGGQVGVKVVSKISGVWILRLLLIVLLVLSIQLITEGIFPDTFSFNLH